MQKRNKKFLNLPHYPGGNKALKAFIGMHLKYPDEAIKNHIQGRVYITYEVNDDGNVISAVVTKGLGYGCDEEALRLVKMLKYNKVKNIGQRLKSTMKMTINFNLFPHTNTKTSYQYNYTQTANESDTPKITYSYAIIINKAPNNEQQTDK